MLLHEFCNALASGGEWPAQFINYCFEPAYKHYLNQFPFKGGAVIKHEQAYHSNYEGNDADSDAN
jgi:hypothetical protein